MGDRKAGKSVAERAALYKSMLAYSENIGSKRLRPLAGDEYIRQVYLGV
jgi:hypothetical protein